MKTFKLLSIKLLSVLVLTSATYFPAKAECEFETLIGVDLVSNYIWRGIDCGGVSIQPTLGVAYKGFTLSAWGSMDLTSVKNEYIRNESELGSRYFPKELDFSLSYEYKGLSLAVTDYWFSSDAYFKYKKHNSSHLFEGTVGYDFGFLSLSWNTIFAGADYKENGDRAYSSYFDVSVPFKICGIDWSATMGAAPFKSDVYGSSGFSVINCALGASKEFVISDKITLPVSATLVANPRSDSMYFVFALSF